MFYRQIILWNGLPFRPSIPISAPRALNKMIREKFDAIIAQGLAQAKDSEVIPADEYFDALEREIIPL